MRIAGALLIAWLIAGCQPSTSFKSIDITGANYARELALTDQTGMKRTLADYRGKLVVIFFGFTQCPDVCPTTLSDMAEVRKQLGKKGDAVQVIFVTVDPDRDTQALLAQYVPTFDPSFVALYGDAAQTAAAAREFKVFYQKVPGRTETSYSIDHTAGTYVIDREGKPRLFVRHGTPVADIVSDLERLL
jgi:protein SCO1/2